MELSEVTEEQLSPCEGWNEAEGRWDDTDESEGDMADPLAEVEAIEGWLKVARVVDHAWAGGDLGTRIGTIAVSEAAGTGTAYVPDLNATLDVEMWDAAGLGVVATDVVYA